MELLSTVCGNIEGSLAYGITFILVGRILSTTSSKCYNAYSAGYSYDRAASTFEILAIIAFAIGAFLVITSLLHSGMQTDCNVVGWLHNDTPQLVKEGMADRIIGEFDSSMKELTDTLIQDCE